MSRRKIEWLLNNCVYLGLYTVYLQETCYKAKQFPLPKDSCFFIEIHFICIGNIKNICGLTLDFIAGTYRLNYN